jgi:tape measure domain-containing protein
LKILVNAEVAQAVANLNKVEGSTKKAGVGFKDFAKQVAGYTTAAGLAVSATKAIISGTINLAKESISLAMGFEKARISWGVMLGDMGEGEKMFSRIQDFAAKTPLSFEAVESAARTLKGFGIEAEDIIPTLGKLGDVSQGNSESLSHLALVFGQVKAQGKAMAQDLYQFVNAGIPIFDMLAKSMGVSAGEVKALGAEGKLTFEEIEKAITKATSSGGMFEGMMDKTSKTAAGQWSTAMDNAKMALADIGDVLLDVVTPALESFNAAMERGQQIKFLTSVASGEISGLEEYKNALAIAEKGLEDLRAGRTKSAMAQADIYLYEQDIKKLKEWIVAAEAKDKLDKRLSAGAKAAAAESAKQAEIKKAREEESARLIASGIAREEDMYRMRKKAEKEHSDAMWEAYAAYKKTQEAAQEASKSMDISGGLTFDIDPEKLEMIQNLAPPPQAIDAWDKLVEEIKNAEDALDTFKTGYEAITGLFETYIDLQGNMGDAELARMKKSGATDEEIAKRKAELQKKEFDNQKALSIANAIVSGAEAAVKALTAGPIAGLSWQE